MSNIVFKYLTYLYDTIKYYFFNDNKYHLPFDINEIINNDHFKEFQSNNDINKVIFALNNIPDVTQKILFKNNINIANQYLYLTIKMSNGSIDSIVHNLDNINEYMDDNAIRYVYIRINIINIGNTMNHVNCIIIDKNKKYILLFEPKIIFQYDSKIIFELLHQTFDTQEYRKILPNDIGYNYCNRLQWYDTFCQTYIIFVFFLIILNDNVNPENFSVLFNSIITHKNMGYFLFHAYNLLIENNISICEQNNIWDYPTNNAKNLLNAAKLFLSNDKNEENNFDDIVIKENDDLVIFEKLTLT